MWQANLEMSYSYSKIKIGELHLFGCRLTFFIPINTRNNRSEQTVALDLLTINSNLPILIKYNRLEIEEAVYSRLIL